MPASYSRDLEKLEQSLRYAFSDKGLLLEALTHKSFHYEEAEKSSPYNERLEFLGDSVLGMVIVDYLYRSEKNLSESKMAKMKSYLVQGALLSEMARGLSLGEYLRLGRGEEASGGRDKVSLLADAMEAVFGAIYLDSDYKTAGGIILSLFEDRIQEALFSGLFYDYKSELQEKAQQVYGVLPEYRVTKEEGREHTKVFTVEVFLDNAFFGRGTGRNKKEAETLAAREALGNLKG